MKTYQILALTIVSMLTACGSNPTPSFEGAPSAILPLSDGEKIIFIGDSITDLQSHSHEPDYRNYVSDIQDHLALNPVISKGKGGNTTSHLLARWQNDVIQETPDVLFILIGINDADYQFRFGLSTMNPQIFEANYRSLLDQVKVSRPQTKIVLMSPFFIPLNPLPIGGGYNTEIASVIDQYQDVVGRLAKEYGLLFIDTQQVIDTALLTHSPEALSNDAIHLTPFGNQNLSKAIKELF